MPSIIREMLHGKIGSLNSMTLTKKQKELLTNCVISEEALFEALEESSRKLYDKYDNDFQLFFCETVATHYEEGFKFGLSLGIEAFKRD